MSGGGMRDGGAPAAGARDGGAGPGPGAAGPGSLDDVTAALARDGLSVVGAFAPDPGDGAPPGTGTLVLVGPEGPGMWAAFRAAPEAGDGLPNPLDRWSVRVLTRAAADMGGAAVFPFGGPPWAPFFAWARRGAPVWPSPLGMLVHARTGLWVSFRGALTLPARLPVPPRAEGPGPCAPCPAPCRTACPVGAFGPAGYDAGACRAHLGTAEGAACRDGGCLARRACPVGAGLAPPRAQAAFHLAAFRGAAT